MAAEVRPSAAAAAAASDWTLTQPHVDRTHSNQLHAFSAEEVRVFSPNRPPSLAYVQTFTRAHVVTTARLFYPVRSSIEIVIDE